MVYKQGDMPFYIGLLKVFFAVLHLNHKILYNFSDFITSLVFLDDVETTI